MTGFFIAIFFQMMMWAMLAYTAYKIMTLEKKVDTLLDELKLVRAQLEAAPPTFGGRLERVASLE